MSLTGYNLSGDLYGGLRILAFFSDLSDITVG